MANIVDLSNRELMAMSEDDFEEVINNPEYLKKIGSDAAHVQIVLFHMLRKNLSAIDDFNRSSEKSSNTIKWLTWVIVLLMIVQIIIAVIIYKPL